MNNITLVFVSEHNIMNNGMLQYEAAVLSYKCMCLHCYHFWRNLVQVFTKLYVPGTFHMKCKTAGASKNKMLRFWLGTSPCLLYEETP